MSSAKPGIWVMVSGVFLTITGGAAYAACAPENAFSTAPTGCADLAGVLLVGIFLAIVGTVAAVLGHALRTEAPVRTAVPSAVRLVSPPSPAPLPTPTPVQRPATPSVEVRCPYCDTVRTTQYGGCPACGAWSSEPFAARGPTSSGP